MPRLKLGANNKMPGQRFLEEIEEFERFDRVLKMEQAMEEALPKPGEGPPLIERLHVFQQKEQSKPRAAVNLTLTLETLGTLAWLEKELAMKRGKVIDWLAAGFTAKQKAWDEEKARYEASFQEAMRDKPKRKRRDDDDDDQDED